MIPLWKMRGTVKIKRHFLPNRFKIIEIYETALTEEIHYTRTQLGYYNLRIGKNLKMHKDCV